MSHIGQYDNGVIFCEECRQTATVSDQEARRPIRHRPKCESRAQPAYAVADELERNENRTRPASLQEKCNSNRRAIRDGAISAVLSEDEILSAVKLGYVSINDAQNRDF